MEANVEVEVAPKADCCSTSTLTSAYIMETLLSRIVYTSPFMKTEDLSTDELFLAWYHKTSDEGIRHYDEQIRNNPAFQKTVEEAVNLLQQIQVKEKEITGQQFQDAADRLLKNIADDPD